MQSLGNKFQMDSCEKNCPVSHLIFLVVDGKYNFYFGSEVFYSHISGLPAAVVYLLLLDG